MYVSLHMAPNSTQLSGPVGVCGIGQLDSWPILCGSCVMALSIFFFIGVETIETGLKGLRFNLTV